MTGPIVDNLEVLRAFFDCRKRKRSTPAAAVFEMRLVENICRITRELRDQTWRPGSSMCFAVTVPKPREVWAAQFADRVVHHVIYNRLRPRIEKHFIPTSFACIPGRGTGAAIAWCERALRRATAGWTREAWVLQMDVANFFTSIDRAILLERLRPYCPEPWLWTAVETVFTHDITANAHLPGDRAKLEMVPRHKSLWHAPAGKGLPIGNLTSQFAANVYMNGLDQHVTRALRPRFYGRYVDDLMLVDTDKAKLIAARDSITAFATERLALTMHPGKTHLQRARHGVDFVGVRVLPHRTYLRRTTAQRGTDAIARAGRDDLLAVANSYLGMAHGHATYRLRGRWSTLAAARGLTPVPDRSKMLQRKEA